MSLKTQGTAIYFIDPADNSVNLVGCPTGISLGGDTYDQLEDTCLGDTVRKYKSGLGTPGQASINLNFDPSSPSHLRLYQLSEDRSIDNIKFALGLSDGNVPPTVTASNWTLPATRSWFTFEGYVADFPLDIQLGSLVTGSISIQRSGAKTLTPKT